MRDREEERCRDGRQGANVDASLSWLTGVSSKVARRGKVGTTAPCHTLAGASESCSPSSVFVRNLEPAGLKSNGEKRDRDSLHQGK